MGLCERSDQLGKTVHEEVVDEATSPALQKRN